MSRKKITPKEFSEVATGVSAVPSNTFPTLPEAVVQLGSWSE